MGRIDDRLRELGLALPEAPRPVAAYVPAVRAGRFVFVSGQVPLAGGRLTAEGAVPSAVSAEIAKEAAATCALNALAVLRDALDGDLDRVERVVRLGVFVASDPGFTGQPGVANGASELMQAVFGDAGRHARAAVGSVALPLNATVEVEMIAMLSEKG
jgi:enamine deaminase RidA (YjgF/YER057c/UK114 family)